MAHSSSGLGHRPLKAEITGSNPVCATKSDAWESSQALFVAVLLRALSRMIIDAVTFRAATRGGLYDDGTSSHTDPEGSDRSVL